LAGIVLWVKDSGCLTLGPLELKGLSSWLIFIGLAVNAAVWPIHAWLTDAYPRATATGAVFLCVLTTKSAVYVMARTFPGAEPLVWLGAIMTLVPLVYAAIENDMRRVLAYILINQVGFMLVGVGLASPLAFNGAAAHAFAHIIYDGLLFMALGAVLHMTGLMKLTDLGGLHRSMPLTCGLYLVGAASISGLPFFNGFVSKAMIVSAAGHEGLTAVWLILQAASAGVFLLAGTKLPYLIFFGPQTGLKAKEPPLNMLLAMGLAAALCLGLGLYPRPLYGLLPFAADYQPYSGAHLAGQLQLLGFGALALILAAAWGLRPAEVRAINLDTDWFYRQGGRLFYRLMDRGLNGLNQFSERLVVEGLTQGGRLGDSDHLPGLHQAGLLLWWSALFPERAYTSHAVCVDKSEVFILPGEDFLKLMEEDHDMGYAILRGVTDILKSRLERRTNQLMKALARHVNLESIMA